MLKKYSLKISLVIMLMTFSPLYGITILHPGVKINSKKITAKMYMVNETEMASFTSWKIQNDFLERELVRKETTIAIYKDFNKDLMRQFTNVSTSMLHTSDRLVKQIDGREKDRRAGRRAARKAGFMGLIRGIFYGGGLKVIMDAVK